MTKQQYTGNLTLSFKNGTHHIDNNSCEWQGREFAHTAQCGHPRDAIGNYDHCFSYKADPEYGVEIQNSTNVLNAENCESEFSNADMPKGNYKRMSWQDGKGFELK
ncbi:MAG: hypothetical protein E4G77_01490 [Nitrosopumilus sp.]|nr:MAG: hypothetical protein E4G77_01490 [Nitrosopumilus sp.]